VGDAAIWTYGGNAIVRTTTTTTQPTGWRHIAAVYDQSAGSNQMKIYIDGVEKWSPVTFFDKKTKTLFDKAYDNIVSPDNKIVSYIESRGGVTDVASHVVEKILPLALPTIDHVDLIKQLKVRRKVLGFLRNSKKRMKEVKKETKPVKKTTGA
jgi:hypothetical protein